MDSTDNMRRLYRAHAVLFVCAYFGFLGYRMLTDPHAAHVGVGEQPRAVAVVPDVAKSSAAPERIADAPTGSRTEQAVVAEATPESDPGAAAARKLEHERLGKVALQATRSLEPQKRAEAIDQLNAATPEALQALQSVITTDDAVRNRIRAINSLSVLAERDGARDAAISILRLAMTDTNASVASRANEAYRQLTQSESPE